MPRLGRTPKMHPAAPTTPASAQAEPTTADLPASRAAETPTQPNDPPNVTPCSCPSLPATQPASAAEGHAEPRPGQAKPTGIQWTPVRAPTGTGAPNGNEPQPAAVKTASAASAAKPQPKPNHESRNPSHTP